MVMAIQSNDVQEIIVSPMDASEAIGLTRDIRESLRDAREKVLAVYRREGWRAMNYESFQAWAMGEFEVSWQQVYNMKAAAEFDNELSLFSATGQVYQIPVKHATQLRKLDTPEARVRAYQLAEQQASAQGKEAPTEKIVEQAVHTVKAEETVFQCPYPVVRQMLADGELNPKQARQIAFEMDRLEDKPSQAYIEKLMANYNLVNPELVYPLGHKFFNERQRGKVSLVLDELEASNGRLAGTPLARATINDLKRANQEAQSQHIADSTEQKRMQMLANGEELPVEFALTLFKNSPIKSAKRLIKELPHKDLEGVFELLAQHLGYVPSEAFANVHENDLIEVDFTLHQAGSFENIEEGQDLQVLTRVKPITITINGKSITIHQKRELSFEQLVALAFPDVHHSNYGNFTIEYGELGLLPTYGVVICEGMVFDVMDKALPRE